MSNVTIHLEDFFADLKVRLDEIKQEINALSTSFDVDSPSFGHDVNGIEEDVDDDLPGDNDATLEYVDPAEIVINGHISNADTLIGNEYFNILQAKGGNDVLVGRGGIDILLGGAGIDTGDYSYLNGGSNGVFADLDGKFAVAGENDVDFLNSLENLIGSEHGDVLLGNDGNNVFLGNGGNDFIHGRLGVDVAQFWGKAEDYEVAVLTDNDENVIGYQLTRGEGQTAETTKIIGVEFVQFETGSEGGDVSFFRISDGTGNGGSVIAKDDSGEDFTVDEDVDTAETAAVLQPLTNDEFLGAVAPKLLGLVVTGGASAGDANEDGLDDDNVVQGQYGALTINLADGTVTYQANNGADALQAGDPPGVETFTYRVAGGDEATININVQGTNDDPVVSLAPDGPDIIVERAEDANPTLSNIRQGGVTFVVSDVDSNFGLDLETEEVDETLVSISNLGNPGVSFKPADPTQTLPDGFSVADLGVTIELETQETQEGSEGNVEVIFTYKLLEEKIEFLRENDELTLTYEVVVLDGNGGEVRQNVQIQINGTNDNLEIVANAVDHHVDLDVAESDGESSAQDVSVSGAIAVHDVDHKDVLTASFSNGQASFNDGATPTDAAIAATITTLLNAANFQDEDGAWPTALSDGDGTTVPFTFVLDDVNLDFLAEGDELVLTFDAVVTDGHTDPLPPVPVTITITGTNDRPVITSPVLIDAVKESGDIVGIVEDSPAGNLDSSALYALLKAATEDDLANVPHNPGTVLTVLADIKADLGEAQTLDAPAVNAQAIAVMWDFLDEAYQDAGYNHAGINEAFVLLGVEYARMLKAGEIVELLDVTAKYEVDNNGDGMPQRQQSMHDNLLGNLRLASLDDRFNSPELEELQALVVAVDSDLLNRDIFSGNQGVSDTEERDWDQENGFVPMATGQMAATDADLGDQLTCSTTATSDYGTFEITAGGLWTFKLDNTLPATQMLADGVSATETFLVTVIDDSGATINNSATQLVTVTINGANDAAVITGTASDSVTERSGVLNGTAGDVDASGDLDATDVDSSAAFTEQSNVAKTYGTFSIDAGGAWSYALDDANEDVQALNALGTLTETITVATTDGTTRDITVTINGANDAAVITGTASDSVTERSGVLNGTAGDADASGDLDATDVDSSAAFTEQSNVAKTYGTFSIDAGGAWSYALDDANEDVQALNALGTLTETITVATTDGTTRDITVTINGANDAAVITGTASDSVTERSGVLNGTAGDADASGDLDATDVDSSAAFTEQSNVAKTYGTFSIDAGGAWSYALDDANEDVQALNALGTLTETITVATTDGTTRDITVTINGANDAAVITGTASDSVTERSGVLNGTAGDADASGDLDATDVDSSAAFTEQSNVAKTYGTFSIDAGGAWSYALDDANEDVQALNALGTLTETITVATTDGTTRDITVTINGANDAAVITGTASDSVTERSGVLNGTAGDADASGDLDATDVDSSAAFTEQSNVAKTYGTFSIDAGGAWSYALDDANEDVQALNALGTLTETITVATTDGTTRDITVTINGANDAAVITGTASDSVTERSGVLNGTAGDADASGDLDATDVDSSAAFTEQSNVAKTYGTFSIDAGGAWSYALDDANEDVQALNALGTLTETITVATTDGTTRDITVTINGANDAAVITGTASDSVTERSGVLNGTAGDVDASGDLDATDVDSSAAFTEQSNVAKTYGTFSIDAGGAWSYALDDANEDVQALNALGTLTETITVATTDGTTRDITVTINGANDAAVITGTASDSVTERSGVLNGTAGDADASGDLDATDVDSSAAFTEQSNVAKTYGTFSIDAGGAWSYALDDANEDVQALNALGTLTETITVATTDGTTRDITVTINGANDAAVITGTASDSVTERSGVLNGTAGDADASGDLDATDVDSSAAFTEQSNVAKTYGTFSIDAGGAWSYALDDANEDVQALNALGTLTETITVATTDGTTRDITVTINGANDAAVITGDVEKTIDEDNAPGSTISGDLDHTDVDAADDDDMWVPVTEQAATTYGWFTLTSAGVWTYKLDEANETVDRLDDEDEPLVDEFDVYTEDGTKQTVTITITGTNDNPVITAINLDPSSLVEQADGLGEESTTPEQAENLEQTITVSFTDAELEDTGHTAEITGGAIKSGNGTGLSGLDLKNLFPSTSVTATSPTSSNAGSATFSFVAAASVFDYLDQGQSVTLTYTVKVSDGENGVGEETFDVTITGTNDQPVFASSIGLTIDEEATIGDPDFDDLVLDDEGEGGVDLFELGGVSDPDGQPVTVVMTDADGNSVPDGFDVDITIALDTMFGDIAFTLPVEALMGAGLMQLTSDGKLSIDQGVADMLGALLNEGDSATLSGTLTVTDGQGLANSEAQATINLVLQGAGSGMVPVEDMSDNYGDNDSLGEIIEPTFLAPTFDQNGNSHDTGSI